MSLYLLELQGSKDKQHPQKKENPLGLVSSPNAESEQNCSGLQEFPQYQR